MARPITTTELITECAPPSSFSDEFKLVDSSCMVDSSGIWIEFELDIYIEVRAEKCAQFSDD